MLRRDRFLLDWLSGRLTSRWAVPNCGQSGVGRGAGEQLQSSPGEARGWTITRSDPTGPWGTGGLRRLPHQVTWDINSAFGRDLLDRHVSLWYD